MVGACALRKKIRSINKIAIIFFLFVLSVIRVINGDKRYYSYIWQKKLNSSVSEQKFNIALA